MAQHRHVDTLVELYADGPFFKLAPRSTPIQPQPFGQPILIKVDKNGFNQENGHSNSIIEMIIDAAPEGANAYASNYRTLSNYDGGSVAVQYYYVPPNSWLRAQATNQ